MKQYVCPCWKRGFRGNETSITIRGYQKELPVPDAFGRCMEGAKENRVRESQTLEGSYIQEAARRRDRNQPRCMSNDPTAFAKKIKNKEASRLPGDATTEKPNYTCKMSGRKTTPRQAILEMACKKFQKNATERKQGNPTDVT